MFLARPGRFTAFILLSSLAAAHALFSEAPPAAPSPSSSVLSAGDLPFVKVFDPQADSLEVWQAEEKSPGIKFSLNGGVGTFEVKKSERPWVSVMKNADVDLERYPILSINVLAATKKWYLIVSGPQFPRGFVRLVETSETGQFNFDLRKLSNIPGKQKMYVKLGISHHTQGPLANERVSFDMLSFLAVEPAGPRGGSPLPSDAKEKIRGPDDGTWPVFTASYEDMDQWKESYKDGPQEVRFSVKGGQGIVKGRLLQRSYGTLHRSVKADFDRYPFLEINVLSSSRNWFLLLAHPLLPQGIYRFIETDKPGRYRFNIPQLTGLTGEADVEIQIGVSDPGGCSIQGDTLVFDRLEFKK